VRGIKSESVIYAAILSLGWLSLVSAAWGWGTDPAGLACARSAGADAQPPVRKGSKVKL
jgi:hypothetical protein